MRIAVIGTGISGSLVARLLATRHDVTVFEAADRPGGHAHTVEVVVRGRRFAVDTGFMVFNRRTYPNFSRLLEMLRVPCRPSDMSFSVSCSRTGWEYQGSSLNGLFAQRLNAFRPAFWRMLLDVLRFNRIGTAAVRDGRLRDGRTTGDFLRECGLGPQAIDRYLVPMAAAIWSSRPARIMDCPAEFLVGFFANHGLLQLRDRPRWRTIVGGSRTYVDALLSPIRDELRLGCPVVSVSRSDVGVHVHPATGPPERFDQVVLATHADRSLSLLSDPTSRERRILAAFPYQDNEAVLHTDVGQLPARRRAWASWNYRIPSDGERGASVTYDLSRLQGLRSDIPILLSLNATDRVDPSRILGEFRYRHPAYTRDSIAAQRDFPRINGRNRTHFCGAYWGYGFHEDGVNSALSVARHFGIGLESCTAACTREPSRTAVTNP